MRDVLFIILDSIDFTLMVLIVAFSSLLLIGTPLLLILIRCLQAVDEHRQRNAPPTRPNLAPPTNCPRCRRPAFRTAGAALCDGVDAHGRCASWSERHGECTACGQQLLQVNTEPWQIMSAGEWDALPHRQLAAAKADIPPGFFPPPIRNAVLLLDDRDDRYAAFRAALDAELQIVWWRSAHRMIDDLPEYLRFARLISLDHDLYPADREPDPGDGLDAVRALVAVPPFCPVIVHSSNSERAALMADELRVAGWTCRVVSPFGDDWTRRDWLVAVREFVPLGAPEPALPAAGYSGSAVTAPPLRAC